MAFRRTSIAIFASILSACGFMPNSNLSKPSWLSEATCEVEEIAVEIGSNHFQYDGLSPDGTSLVIGFSNGDTQGAYLLDLATNKRTELPYLNNSASFSPNGDKLILGRYRDKEPSQIVSYSLTTNKSVVIASSKSWDTLPSYAPNGRTIVFNSYRTGGSDIYTYNFDTGELQQRTDHVGEEANAQFSPNGETILFHRDVGDRNFDLMLIDVATNNINSITSSSAEESYGSWSPDGETIVFSSSKLSAPDQNDLYLMNKSGDIFRRLTQGSSNDTYPFFSKNGKFIYFNAVHNGEYGIYRLQLTSSLSCANNTAP